jgi:uncharacterized protein YjlB
MSSTPLSVEPRPVEPIAFLFKDDGETPNNPRLPLILYRDAVDVSDRDPAAAFEAIFARNGWGWGWRNGIFDFRHFHLRAHEVLGIARGSAQVEFGGAGGKVLEVKAGDVAILPAGCGHRRVSSSRDLLVVGAYPPGNDSAHSTPERVDRVAAARMIAGTPMPSADPVYGKDGVMMGLWCK